MTSADDTFLARWSRRKQEARSPGAAPDGTAGAAPTGPNDPQGLTAPSAGREAIDRHTEAMSPGPSSPAAADRFKDFDFETLDASSDYKQFMAADVPDHIRTKALARLWTSNPILAAPDPFSDCVGDFTDAARAVPGGLLRTAYKLGQGFLSDEEAAVWDRLGRPEPKAGEAGAAPEGAAPEAAEGPAANADLPPIAQAIAAVHAEAAAGRAPAAGVAPGTAGLPTATPAA